MKLKVFVTFASAVFAAMAFSSTSSISQEIDRTIEIPGGKIFIGTAAECENASGDAVFGVVIFTDNKKLDCPGEAEDASGENPGPPKEPN